MVSQFCGPWGWQGLVSASASKRRIQRSPWFSAVLVGVLTGAFAWALIGVGAPARAGEKKNDSPGTAAALQQDSAEADAGEQESKNERQPKNVRKKGASGAEAGLPNLFGTILRSLFVESDATESPSPEPIRPLKVDEGTFSSATAIKVKSSVAGHALLTFCLNRDGHVLALVGPPKYFEPGTAAAKAPRTSVVLEYDADGEFIKEWKIKFAAQAINVAPDGSVYIGGSSHVAKFDREGVELADRELPHVAALLKDRDALRKLAEEQIEQSRAQYEPQLKVFREQRERLVEDAKAEKAAKSKDDAQGEDKQPVRRPRRRSGTSIEQIDRTIKQLEQMQKREVKSVDEVLEGLIRTLGYVNALAVSEKDVFVAGRERLGYGFSIWRMNLDLEQPEQIVTGLSGCCGQMDIQCCNGQVWAAENSRHRVRAFDREGKQLLTFGKSSREGADGMFAGCCNPMNIRFGTDGSVLTAESEGLVKKFSPAGEYVEAIGRVTLTGGCKNVAVDVSSDGHRVYFCDLPGSRIIVLKEPEKSVTQAE